MKFVCMAPILSCRISGCLVAWNSKSDPVCNAQCHMALDHLHQGESTWRKYLHLPASSKACSMDDKGCLYKMPCISFKQHPFGKWWYVFMYLVALCRQTWQWLAICSSDFIGCHGRKKYGVITKPLGRMFSKPPFFPESQQIKGSALQPKKFIDIHFRMILFGRMVVRLLFCRTLENSEPENNELAKENYFF